jgi:hypothetical protein
MYATKHNNAQQINDVYTHICKSIKATWDVLRMYATQNCGSSYRIVTRWHCSLELH